MSRNTKFSQTAKQKSTRVVTRRRGATLVLIAIVMTVLVMFGGIGIDFGRMYTFNAQLKVLADAASLAAAIELRNGGTEANGDVRALALKPSNTVDGGQIAIMDDTNVTPGNWDFDARTFTPGSWAGANAIRARTRYDASWTLARIFGVTTKMLVQESVAALGGQVVSSCLKPFALPYGALLPRVGQASSNLSYELTAADIATLTNGTPITWQMVDDLPANTPPGSFSMVGFDPTYSSMSKNAYLDSILPSGCTSDPVSVGDSIPAITGVSQGLVLPGLRELCPGARNQNDQAWTCSTPVTFQVPVYDEVYGSGNNGEYRIKYIAGYRMTAVDFTRNRNNITGFITSFGAQSGGGFSPFPGPVKVAAIVQ